jgi:hypothetical protein
MYEAKTFAVASVFAKKEIVFDNMPVAPMLYDNDYGAEVLEMELGETEARLGEIFGVDVVPAGKVMQEQPKAYGHLPEVSDPETFTRLNDMTAVDVDAKDAAATLGALAGALHVDAVVVLSHEWTLERDRFEVNEGVTAFDRCTLLVVDKDGNRLWDDVVIVRIPAQELDTSAFGVGLNGATWADEARQLARRAAREALDTFERRYRASRTAPPGSSLRSSP